MTRGFTLSPCHLVIHPRPAPSAVVVCESSFARLWKACGCRCRNRLRLLRLGVALALDLFLGRQLDCGGRGVEAKLLRIVLVEDVLVSRLEVGELVQHLRDLAGLCVELQRGPLSALESATKRIVDVLFAGTALIALLPLLAIVSLAIKLDSQGPILFRQQRCGFNGRSFAVYKFRTMSVLENGPSIIQAGSADSRVTGIGKWLRRTSIDELPQLINVLRGEMSIVGPRPHAVAHDNECSRLIENYALRHHVKPGITGWAQVHGLRGQTNWRSMQERVELDLWYINNWSPFLDLRIIAKTFVELARRRNAW